jgi:hypothetical protein
MIYKHPHLIGRQSESPALQEDLARIEGSHDLDPAVIPRRRRQDGQRSRRRF